MLLYSKEIDLKAHLWLFFHLQRNWPKPKKRTWTCTRCWTKPSWSSTIYRDLFRATWRAARRIQQNKWINTFSKNLPPKDSSVHPFRWNFVVTSTVLVKQDVQGVQWWPAKCLFQTESYFVCTRNCIHCRVPHEWNFPGMHKRSSTQVCQVESRKVSHVWPNMMNPFSLNILINVTKPTSISFKDKDEKLQVIWDTLFHTA